MNKVAVADPQQKHILRLDKIIPKHYKLKVLTINLIPTWRTEIPQHLRKVVRLKHFNFLKLSSHH